MADERKYQDDEVKEIFDLAIGEDPIGRPPTSDEAGLSLSELQEVGLEVGMEPERIAEAALAVDSRRGILPSRRYLGMPISVGRVVELPGPVTDQEWQLLVAEFREVFGARGRIASHGGVREWTNGNLHALVEPTATGHRLRLGTLKGGAKALMTMGVAMMMLVGAGGAALASNVLSLPRWARARKGQMEYIAGRVGALVGAPPQSEESNLEKNSSYSAPESGSIE